jgi:glycosyltransferase involved in cell wall biosynthesis
VIPTHNRGDLIAHTIDSVLTQKFPAAEVIVIDDASTDNTKEVIAKFGSRVVYRKITWSGVQAARNLGIKLSRTSWIALCDSDDLWRADHLALQAELILSNPDLNFVFSNTSFVIDGRWLPENKFYQTPPGYWDRIDFSREGRAIVFKGSLVPLSISEYNLVLMSAVSFTRDLVNHVGYFDPRLRDIKSEDWEFTLRCLYSGRVGAVLEPTVGVRRHAGNSTTSQAAVSDGDAKILEFVLRHHSESEPYRALIEAEIKKRYARAFDSAFVEMNHELVKKIYTSLPADYRTALRQLKRIISSLPDPTARTLNAALQTTREAVARLSAKA